MKDKSAPKLSRAQWRMLEELAEPNGNNDGSWYFPGKSLRTLRSLVGMGFARATESNAFLHGFAITDTGRVLVKGTAEAATGGEGTEK